MWNVSFDVTMILQNVFINTIVSCVIFSEIYKLLSYIWENPILTTCQNIDFSHNQRLSPPSCFDAVFSLQLFNLAHLGPVL